MLQRIVERGVPVAFAGDGAGSGPLSWGQKAILQDMRETGWTHNASGAHNLPEGSTVESAAAELAALVGRHPALRTRLGTDEHGQPCQRVSAAGELIIEVLTVPADVEPAEAAQYTDQLWYDWLLTPFDAHQDWPIRVGLVQHRGATLYRVLTFNHVVVDGASIMLLMAELGLGEPAGRRNPDPATVQLLELGRREQLPAARRISDRAMNYWQSQLRDIPSRTFGEPSHPEGRLGQRFWHGRFSSPATYLAVLAIAQRTGTDASRVLFAVIATAVGRATGVSALTAKVIMSNRFRPGFAEAIAPLSQNSVVTMQLAGQSVDEVIGQARRQLLAAGMYAYYDPDQLNELIERLDEQRGYPAQVSCRINDRRITTRESTEQARTSAITPARISEQLAATTLSWDGTVDHLHEQAFITVEDVPDTVYLQLIFDMHCFTEAQVETLLYGIEQVAIAAAYDDAVPTGLPAPAGAPPAPSAVPGHR